MSFTAFIVPITMIFVQLMKTGGFVDKRWLPWAAVVFGAFAGLTFGMYYRQDLFVHVFQGFLYGATASGLYDAVKSTKPEEA